jgi:ABC transporter substrate binding protein
MAGACDAHRTKRRHFLPLIASLWLPRAVRGQQQKVVTIGVLVVGIPASETFFRSFRQHMRTLEYIEGENVRYEFRSDGGQAARLPDLAAELVRLNVDVIVTWYTPPAQAAKQATRDIPIVMALAGKSRRNRARREPGPAGRQHYRHGWGRRRIGQQDLGIDPADAAVGAPRRGARQRLGPFFEAFCGVCAQGWSGHRNSHRCADDPRAGRTRGSVRGAGP